MTDKLNDNYPFYFSDSIQDVVNAVATLTDREEKVLEMRLKNGITLKECGEEFGVSRERIRQIEKKALEKIRRKAMSDLYLSAPVAEYKILESKYSDLQDEYKRLAEAVVDVKSQNIMPTSEYIMNRQTPIEKLGLSVRAYNSLKGAEKNTIKDVAEMTIDDLMKVRNIGKNIVQEIISVMEENGFYIREKEAKTMIQFVIPDDTREVVILIYNNPVNGIATDYIKLNGRSLNDAIVKNCKDCKLEVLHDQ